MTTQNQSVLKVTVTVYITFDHSVSNLELVDTTPRSVRTTGEIMHIIADHVVSKSVS